MAPRESTTPPTAQEAHVVDSNLSTHVAICAKEGVRGLLLKPEKMKRSPNLLVVTAATVYREELISRAQGEGDRRTTKGMNMTAVEAKYAVFARGATHQPQDLPLLSRTTK